MCRRDAAIVVKARADQAMTTLDVPAPPHGATELRDLPAPAKLNVFLHVIGRRDDGMHLLQSLFVLIDWCDTLHVALRDDGLVVREDLGTKLPDDDLCLRAARALQQAGVVHTGKRPGAHIRIDKRVPWGAGLGGGSSDAATTLIALNRLWGLGLRRAELAAIAATLGADVPFFVGGRHAFVEGIGERLAPLNLPEQRFLVVKPAASLGTAEVFRHPMVVRDTPALHWGGGWSEGSGDGSGEEPGGTQRRTPRDAAADRAADILRGFLAGASQGSLGARNDLQSAACALCPEVSQALNLVRSRAGNARMSGSGSAVFAVLGEEDGAAGSPQASDQAFEPWPEGWTIRWCRSLDRHPLHAWLD